MTLIGFTEEQKRERHKQQQKEWRENNRERKNMLDKRWRDKNLEALRERSRIAYYKKKHKDDDSILSCATAVPEPVL